MWLLDTTGLAFLFIIEFFHKKESYTLWTVNDVPEKDPLERPRGIFTASVGAFHLERPLKFQFTAFEGSFKVKLQAVKNPRGLSVKNIRVFLWDIIEGVRFILYFVELNISCKWLKIEVTVEFLRQWTLRCHFQILFS